MTGKPFRTVALLLCLLAHAGAGAADPAVSPEQIERWVGELGAEDFATRENASEQLWKAGRAAEATLVVRHPLEIPTMSWPGLLALAAGLGAAALWLLRRRRAAARYS